jgi:DNA-binding CsgD family transcriptional regulator
MVVDWRIGTMPYKKKPLTEREREILKWIAEGKTSADVGAILGLSQRTVEWHTNRAVEKLEAVNRIQAVARAVRYGLVPLLMLKGLPMMKAHLYTMPFFSGLGFGI